MPKEDRFDRCLRRLLVVARISVAATYRPGEVQAILKISDKTFRSMCDRWLTGDQDQGLESYLLFGGHRRVPHHALVEWLQRRETNADYRT